ncbi:MULTISPECIES: general secretion pathway protein GspC [Mycetohabitans]|uniref:general secretion pathway protein GspC n=1 Tax=Mycetohabitans TaxID=2571159 RepID=UPI001F23A628|nr:general secretion pathway protein GspC [Mycetohabitans sp. B3]MCF2132697.1 general secretion pathway protein GspC [Mycetohabitans sp. B3]
MNFLTQRLAVRLLSLALFAVLCATVTYWVVTLGSRDTAPLPAAAPGRLPVTIDAAQTLFGSHAGDTRVANIHLSGILALADGAAAIVSYGADPARAISLNSPIARGVKLVAVRQRSIVVERNGGRSEIFLPPNAQGQPTIYVR